jgi:hypothetical protein
MLGLCRVAYAGEDPPPTADSLPPRHRLVYSNTLAGRFNPLGLEDDFSIGYRYRLYDDPGPLWRDANLRVAFEPSTSPAIGRLGGTVEVEPIAVLKLRVSYYFMGFYSSFGDVQSYPSPLATFSDTALSQGHGYATWGGQAELGAAAQGKLGPVALRDEVIGFRSDFSLHAGDTVFYDPRTDELTPRHGWLLTNDTDLLWVTNAGLLVGLRASEVEPFYAASDYLPGQAHVNPNGPTVRAGPIGVYTVFDRPGASLASISVFAIVNWWLTSRWRTGEDVSQAVPYIVAGFAFSGDVIPFRR